MGPGSGTRDFEALVDGAPSARARQGRRPWDDPAPDRSAAPFRPSAPAPRDRPGPTGSSDARRRRHARRRNGLLLALGLVLVLPWLFAEPDPDIALTLALAFVGALVGGLALIGVAAGGLASAVVDRRALFSRLVPVAAGVCMIVFAVRSGADPGDLGFTVLDGTGPRLPDAAELTALGLAFDVVAGAAFALRSILGLVAALARRLRA